MNTHSTTITTITRATPKFSQFFAILTNLQRIGYNSDRDELIHTFTEGRTESLKDLTPTEYIELIQMMQAKYNEAFQSRIILESRQKRKIIALFCQMGYVKNEKADMPRINGWCISHGHLKKTLNHYHGKDLIKLLNQADKVYESFIKSL